MAQGNLKQISARFDRSFKTHTCRRGRLHSSTSSAPQKQQGQGRTRKVEEAVSNPTPLAILGVFCALAAQQALAQQVACGSDQVCIAEDAGAVRPDEQPRKLASLALTQRCQGTAVDVTTASEAERQLACSAAGEAIRILGRCGIAPRKPVHVQIMSEVRHPFGGPVFGLFDIRHEKVLVTREEGIPALVKDTPYADLPGRDFYRSLVVHEVVHGIMHQNLRRQPTSHAAYEYPAYALQIESLPPAARERFLRSFDKAAPRSDFVFSDPVLQFDPYFFAARAYWHLQASADRCALLGSLLTGEVSFIAPSR